MEWLGSLAVIGLDDAIAGLAVELAARLQGAVGAELSQAAAPAPEVITVLPREPEAELQVLLDLLEPMGLYTPEPHPTVGGNTTEQGRITNRFRTTFVCPVAGDDTLVLKPKHADRAGERTPRAIPRANAMPGATGAAM